MSLIVIGIEKEAEHVTALNRSHLKNALLEVKQNR